jgi:predicted dehydrogenase
LALTFSDPVRVGVVGCGTISAAYLKNMTASPHLEVIACADAVPERAVERAAEFAVPKAMAVDELINDPDVELVLNLTVPNAHAPINLAALQAGKHVYTEKPLATTREDGRRTLEEAAKRSLHVGCAPDTFLGSGIQTCLALLGRKELGEPLAASGFMLSRGPENWHPNPGIFYSPGGGPMLDVGPYYVTALACFLGPARRVTGLSRILYPERTAHSGPRAGETFKVSTPTFVAGLIEYESGAIATLVTSFGISGHDLPNLQVYCGEGILGVPDPNYFGGPVRIRAAEEESAWREVPLIYRHTDVKGRNYRGLGVEEMAQALRRREAPRASGELGFHVLDVMLAIEESNRSGRHIDISSRFRKPPPLPLEESLAEA